MFYTFTFLKPDAIRRGLTTEILLRFLRQGFRIELFSHEIVTENRIFAHYEHKIEEEGTIFKEKATNTFLNRSIIPVVWGGNDSKIITTIRKLIGATCPTKADNGTIRGDLGVDSMEQSIIEVRCCENLVHASDSIESYYFEMELWFGKEIAEEYRCY